MGVWVSGKKLGMEKTVGEKVRVETLIHALEKIAKFKISLLICADLNYVPQRHLTIPLVIAAFLFTSGVAEDNVKLGITCGKYFRVSCLSIIDAGDLDVIKTLPGMSFKNVNRHKGKAHINNAPRNSEGTYHRYGGNGYWVRTYRTPKHLVDLYQASIKEKGVETNFLDQAKPMDIPDPVSFARLLAQIIKLRAQFLDYPIKSIQLDNAGEFMSQTFDDYCMTLGIDVEHPVPHIHNQNGLAEALIKRLQLIAHTLLIKTKLPVSTWDMPSYMLHHCEYLIKEGYTNNVIFPCVFIKKSNSRFAIVAVYVDDMNLVRTSEELNKTAEYLKSEFEMKDLGKTKLCLGLQIKHCASGILVHQLAYIEKILKRFGMDKAYPLSTPMVVRSLDIKKDPFRPKEDDELVLGPEVPYLSAIGALLYLAQCTRPDIAFSVNLLASYSSAPTIRHWKGVEDVLRYLRGTTDVSLFYSEKSSNDQVLVKYADAGFLSDPHKAASQTGYVFKNGDTTILWRSTKQTLVATSSNHSEILALHEASRECSWLRSMIHHIRNSCGLPLKADTSTVIHENNAACVSQMKEGFIKGDKTKHISPKFFSVHELQKAKVIEVKQIHSNENLANLFTKSLLKCTFQKLVQSIGLCRLTNQINFENVEFGGDIYRGSIHDTCMLYSFSFD
ncbi:hypothetical protein D8674_038086 [Pyrus ussuriensis x Pyrus communis]|uniref:Reverse transcriptase Ty1/copia-type domain-containing protein n=1 Tax=Pyrus ussuriensis x Pyrus communis TaxID=2448454 RepID=A0A5N5I7V2_9ROSA|nr:hypothetical protein D8674_038086 [Pyrus ussuriensis x Pyrus communis]